jgi:hypothetical protein
MLSEVFIVILLNAFATFIGPQPVACGLLILLSNNTRCDALGASIPIYVLRIQNEEQRQKYRREFKGASGLRSLRHQHPVTAAPAP